MQELPEESHVSPNGPLYVPRTEPTVHNAAGFCSDPTCPCKQDRELLLELYDQYLNGEVSEEGMARLYQGKW